MFDGFLYTRSTGAGGEGGKITNYQAELAGLAGVCGKIKCF